MTWLDRLLIEETGAVVQELPPEEARLPGGDRWAGPLFDPTLEALCSGLPPKDALDLREERAAILEHLAGLPRSEAEQRAGIAPRMQRTA